MGIGAWYILVFIGIMKQAVIHSNIKILETFLLKFILKLFKGCVRHNEWDVFLFKQNIFDDKTSTPIKQTELFSIWKIIVFCKKVLHSYLGS